MYEFHYILWGFVVAYDDKKSMRWLYCFSCVIHHIWRNHKLYLATIGFMTQGDGKKFMVLQMPRVPQFFGFSIRATNDYYLICAHDNLRWLYMFSCCCIVWLPFIHGYHQDMRYIHPQCNRFGLTTWWLRMECLMAPWYTWNSYLGSWKLPPGMIVLNKICAEKLISEARIIWHWC